jgi:hypothetical protein
MSINMQLEQVQLTGITKNDLQEIYDNALKEVRTRFFFIDASYLYTFHLDDFNNVRQFNLLGRYYSEKLKELNIKRSKHIPINQKEYEIVKQDNSRYCREWHRCLELWYDDKYVTLGDRRLKPIQISRTLDRVVNEGMEILAGSICGQGDAKFDCRGIGDGDVDEATIADTSNSHDVDVINVNETAEGGSLSLDGTTVYSIGNHSKEVETPVDGIFTECAMYDNIAEPNRFILDHSIFDSPIEHEQNADSPGSTTVLYMCSG